MLTKRTLSGHHRLYLQYLSSQENAYLLQPQYQVDNNRKQWPGTNPVPV